jgi:hypothetical protein
VALYRPLGAASNALGFKAYRLGAPIVLSDSLPMLEHMGVRVLGEQNHRIENEAGSVSLHDFDLQGQVADEFDPDTLATPVRRLLRARVPRRGGERRLQPPGAARRPRGRRDRDPARVCEVPEADRLRAVASA